MSELTTKRERKREGGKATTGKVGMSEGPEIEEESKINCENRLQSHSFREHAFVIIETWRSLPSQSPARHLLDKRKVPQFRRFSKRLKMHLFVYSFSGTGGISYLHACLAIPRVLLKSFPRTERTQIPGIEKPKKRQSGKRTRRQRRART